MMSQLVSRPWYCVTDSNGNEIGDVRWLRIGRGQWYIEVGKWGVAARFGAIRFGLYFDQGEEDD